MNEQPFSVERIDHVALTVRNLQASADWYARILGLETHHRWSPEPWMIGQGGTWLALFERPQGTTVANLWGHVAFQHLAFHVKPEHFETAQEHLRSSGIRFEGPVDHDVSFSIYFNDPDGHRLEITCYPPERAKAT